METVTTEPKPKRKPKRKRQHGTGGIYKRGRGWLIKWRENGRQRYKTFTDEDLARKALAKITKDVQTEGVGLPVVKPPAPPLAKLAEAWLERREKTHRSWRDDKSRWNKHLKPAFGSRRPDDLDEADLRRFIEAKLSGGMNPGTVQLCIRLLSTFYAELVEQGHADDNPVRKLPRSTRRLYRSTHDPRTTPFLRSQNDVRRVFQALPEPVNVAFAIGALAGLRTGEILGLEWSDIDMAGRRIHVHQQVQDGEVGPLKDDESRTVPIVSSLYPIVAAYRLKGATGMVFKPACSTRGGRDGSPPRFMRPHTLHGHLEDALAACKLPEMDWYSATRHTYGSLFVLAGGSLERLAKLMGHSSVTITERHYCHLRVDLFRPEDYDLFDVDLRAVSEVTNLPRSDGSEELGCTVVTPENARCSEIA